MFRQSIKKLYVNLIWQLCLFILTVNISASIFQALDYQDSVGKVDQRITNKEDIIANFSSVNNISERALEDFLKTVEKVKETKQGTQKPMSYSKAFILSLSLFFTIGWGDVYPSTSLGKVFAVIMSVIGIPLTLTLIVTGGTIFMRHMLELIKITQNQSARGINNKYSEQQIRNYSKKLLTPILLILTTIYILFSSFVLHKQEEMSYSQALWYSFVTLSTIGFGDVTQKNVFKSGNSTRQVGLVMFNFFWILIGMILIAASFLSVITNGKKVIHIKKERQKERAPQHTVHVVGKLIASAKLENRRAREEFEELLTTST